LHYEYRVGGVHRNPRTVVLPPADPIAAEQQAAFRAVTEPLWRQLDGFVGPMPAVADTAPARPASAGRAAPLVSN
jgi:hypothetical protein